MAHFIDCPMESSMSLLTVSNKIIKPQDEILFHPMLGIDKDGETVRKVYMEIEFKDYYFVIFFFPMDFKVDSSEILSFKEHIADFSKNNCKIVGVTSDSPLAIKRWISKDVSGGGFGGPVGFPILSDKDLSLSMSMGVARDCGMPARATFIIDWTGVVRYMMVHRSDIGRSVKDILRLVQAFRHSDLTGKLWLLGGPLEVRSSPQTSPRRSSTSLKSLVKEKKLRRIRRRQPRLQSHQLTNPWKKLIQSRRKMLSMILLKIYL